VLQVGKYGKPKTYQQPYIIYMPIQSQSTLKMEVAGSFETAVNIRRTLGVTSQMTLIFRYYIYNDFEILTVVIVNNNFS
jgi:hypothetical protein